MHDGDGDAKRADILLHAGVDDIEPGDVDRLGEDFGGWEGGVLAALVGPGGGELVGLLESLISLGPRDDGVGRVGGIGTEVERDSGELGSGGRPRPSWWCR